MDFILLHCHFNLVLPKTSYYREEKSFKVHRYLVASAGFLCLETKVDRVRVQFGEMIIKEGRGMRGIELPRWH